MTHVQAFSDSRHAVYGGSPTFRQNVGENQNGAHCASCEGAQLKKFSKHDELRSFVFGQIRAYRLFRVTKNNIASMGPLHELNVYQPRSPVSVTWD